jgi:hypothetical protein
MTTKLAILVAALSYGVAGASAKFTDAADFGFSPDATGIENTKYISTWERCGNRRRDRALAGAPCQEGIAGRVA